MSQNYAEPSATVDTSSSHEVVTGTGPFVYRVDRAWDRRVSDNAVSRLAQGELVVLPTDTGYALCGRVLDAAVLDRVYSAKGRDPSKPLHVLVGSIEAARRIVEIDPRIERLMQRLLPGPLTLVLPASESAPRGLNRGGTTIGVRIPDLSFTLEVLRKLDEPVTATSANPSGGPAPFDGAAVRAAGEVLGVSAIYDAGELPHQRASTIVELLPGQAPRVLREGPVDLSSILGGLRENLYEHRVGI